MSLPQRCSKTTLLPLLLLFASTAFSQSQDSASTTLKTAAASHGITVSTAADSAFLSEPRYAEILGSEFSALEPENAMKFGPIHPKPGNDPSSYNFAPADRLVSFAQQHGMKVRGHTLVWHEQNAPWLKSGRYSTQELSEILHAHIQSVVSHYAGKVYAWDVVNEAFNDNGTLRKTIWYNKPGIGFARQGTHYIEQAFQWAHTADPNAKLIYNDYGAETINSKSNAIYRMARDFKQRSVPLNGIGMQMHIDLNFDRPTKLKSFSENIKRFGELGLEVHITELDIKLRNNKPQTLQAQARLYRKLASICREQPSCKLFQTWGFTDKHSWIPYSSRGYGWALLWDENYKTKPAYDAVVDGLK